MPRTETIEKTFYAFDELDEDAKEKAREWWRNAESGDDFWSESVVEDFATICDMLGLDINQRAVKTMGGTTRYEPAVYWSGFYSQGDGAAFDGSYSYKPGAAKAIRAHAPKDVDLHKIADCLQDVQRKYFYKLNARVSQTGRYFSMSVDVEHDEDSYRDIGDAEEDIKDCFNDLAHWFYCALRDEYEHHNADEQVDDNIRANEYEFDEFGNVN
jgi:hypothetical protein